MNDHLECPECGDVAVMADEHGMFDEDMSGPCLSCGVVGTVYISGDDERPIAYFRVNQ